MNNQFKLPKFLLFVAAVSVGFTACKKTSEVTPDDTSIIATEGAVAIAPSSGLLGGATTSSSDSVYAIDACKKTHSRKVVLQKDLPTAIGTYLTANYEGYTFLKAFSTTLISTNVLDSYVVGFLFNGKPVAIRFGKEGAFIKVLELRERRDIGKPEGHHAGGFFDNRDGKQRDSIAIAALAQNIKQYFTTNYPKDTLKGAWLNKDASIVVVSKNVTFFATAFKLDGTFIKRSDIPFADGKDREITLIALPKDVLAYLNTTYPNFVFKKAFEQKVNGVLKGYLLIVDANNTKYAVLFNAQAQFVAVKIIR